MDESVARVLKYPDAELLELQVVSRERRRLLNQPDYASVQTELRSELARLRTELKVPAQEPATAFGNARRQLNEDELVGPLRTD